MIISGSWVCFNNINNVPAGVLSVCAQLLSSLLAALKEGKNTVVLQSEEIHLHPDGAAFALIDSRIKVPCGNPEKLLSFNSAIAGLPDSLLKSFRTVSIITPDLRPMLEVLLLCQGKFDRFYPFYNSKLNLTRLSLNVFKVKKLLTFLSIPLNILFQMDQS